MNEKLIKILEALFWVITSVILAVCDFVKGGVVYTIFGCVFTIISVFWTYLLANYINDYRE